MINSRHVSDKGIPGPPAVHLFCPPTPATTVKAEALTMRCVPLSVSYNDTFLRSHCPNSRFYCAPKAILFLLLLFPLIIGTLLQVKP